MGIIAVKIDGAPNSLEEVSFGEVKKGEAVDAVCDGVGQAASLTDNGQGAVLEAVYLIQAAGFKQRWHEEDIGTGFYLVGQFIVKAD